jgi:hypothetical protein
VRSGRAFDHSPPSSAAVMEEYLYPPSRPHRSSNGITLPLLLPIRIYVYIYICVCVCIYKYISNICTDTVYIQYVPHKVCRSTGCHYIDNFNFKKLY